MFPGQSERPQDWSPSSIRLQLEGSLRRLGTDYVDLYQLHNARIEPIETTRCGRSDDTARRGQDPRDRRRARPRDRVGRGRTRVHPRRPIASLQTVFNILEQEPGLTFAREIRDEGKRSGSSRACRTRPDTLSGKVTRDTVFPPEDHRSHRNRDNMLDNFDKADTLAFLWDGTGRTAARPRSRASSRTRRSRRCCRPTSTSTTCASTRPASEMPLTPDEWPGSTSSGGTTSASRTATRCP
jgi:aryl-alcohol dehydrogenase-like predicted oxidoreductase